jgi:hypothetical protein
MDNGISYIYMHASKQARTHTHTHTHTHEAPEEYGDIKIGHTIRTVRYADDLVLLDEVQQCMIDRLN